MRNWPPTDENAYGDDHYKKGNFFTMRDEDHPAYVLFRALTELGWTWDKYKFKGQRHWLHMTKGNRFIDFSLWGQGQVGSFSKFDDEWGSEYNEWGIGLEDYNYEWINALPHIIEFMRATADYRQQMMKEAREAYEKRHGEKPDW